MVSSSSSSSQGGSKSRSAETNEFGSQKTDRGLIAERFAAAFQQRRELWDDKFKASLNRRKDVEDFCLPCENSEQIFKL